MLGAIAGIVTAAVAMGVAQLVAGVIDLQASPLIAVGQAAIDATPEWLKSFAIRTFGSNDKTVLLAGIGDRAGARRGRSGRRVDPRPRVGPVGVVVFGRWGSRRPLTRPAPASRRRPSRDRRRRAGAGTFVRPASRARPPGAGGDAPAVAARRHRSSQVPVGGRGRRRRAAAAGAVGKFIARRFGADASRAAVRIPAPASDCRPGRGARHGRRERQPVLHAERATSTGSTPRCSSRR